METAMSVLHDDVFDMEECVRDVKGMATALCMIIGSMTEEPAQQAAYSAAVSNKRIADELHDRWSTAIEKARKAGAVLVEPNEVGAAFREYVNRVNRST